MMRRVGLGLAALCGVAGAAAAPIPFKVDAPAGAALPGGAVGVLLLSLLAIAAVYLVRKRLNLRPFGAEAGAPRLLRVVETQRLGPRALLSVVDFAGGRYLIAQSEQGVSCLVALPAAAAPVAEPEAP
ncbi:hypothetical protein CSQ96_20805 [Janthinobacterium sp. BJB412]|nr:hypothetical protein CSQ96_20805 [Janthinobacterium sp. BJB412]